jgi:hypothetical protein
MKDSNLKQRKDSMACCPEEEQGMRECVAGYQRHGIIAQDAVWNGEGRCHLLLLRRSRT